MESYPREDQTFHDRTTGAVIRQVTRHPSVHHAPFFLSPAYDDAMRWLVFISHRTGQPQIFVEERATGTLHRLTDVDDLHPWSIHPSHDGRFVYFLAGSTANRVSTADGSIERLWSFPQGDARGVGMVAAGMGTTALSRCDRYWAIKVNRPDSTDLVVVNTDDGSISNVVRRDTIAHVQFRPDDGTQLFFAGNFKERLWTVRVDGTELKSHYDRRPGEWITHESWIPGSRELMFVDWPNGVRAVNVDTGHVRHVVKGNAWHPSARRDGIWIVADTNAPDVGIVKFRADGTSTLEQVCASNASSEGKHWWGPFPYEDGPILVQARQHTHPHPTYSPDGTRIIFGSDQSGFSQLYEVVVDLT